MTPLLWVIWAAMHVGAMWVLLAVWIGWIG
jgi:hypothetical protein